MDDHTSSTSGNKYSSNRDSMHKKNELTDDEDIVDTELSNKDTTALNYKNIIFYVIVGIFVLLFIGVLIYTFFFYTAPPESFSILDEMSLIDNHVSVDVNDYLDIS